MQSVERGAHPARSALALLGLLFFILPLSVAGGYLLPSPVALVIPAPVEPVDALIKVDGTSYESQGHLYLTGVRLTLDPRLGQYLLAQLQTDVEVVPKSEVLPPTLSREEFLRLSQRLLEESLKISQVVALRQAGYDVRLGTAFVEVVGTIPGSAAAQLLQPEDIIEAADGEPITTAAELVSIVQGRISGEPVTLRLRRKARELTVTLPAMRGPLDTEGPVLGAIAVTKGFDSRMPVNVTLDPAPTAGGPSAGLMYALGIYNAVVTEDITRGHRVAGTGTLRLNGTVGPVAAVRLKVQAAEDAGAEYFLVPVEDAAVAKAAARDIKILAVHNFKEALTALRQAGSEPGGNMRVAPSSGDTILASAPAP